MRGGRVAVTTTGWLAGWLTQQPPWTGNRWDLNPSSQITAKDTLVCSCDRFKMTTNAYSNKRRVWGWGSEGNMEGLRSSGGEMYPCGTDWRYIDGILTVILMIKPDTFTDLQSSGLWVSLRRITIRCQLQCFADNWSLSQLKEHTTLSHFTTLDIWEGI